MAKKIKNIYIPETHTLWQENGEVHILNDTHHIVWNGNSLFNDLNGLMHFAIRARESDEKRVIETQINQMKRITEGLWIKWDWEKSEEFIKDVKELRKKYEENKNNTTTENS